jgi:NAD(P)H-dependent FMN reductase
MYIPVILGTARQGRQSEKAARFILREALAASLESEIIDVRDHRIAATDNTGSSPQAQRLAEKVKRADGFIIVSPEYNHGYPGELKMMLDMLFWAYAKKPVGICGKSAWPFTWFPSAMPSTSQRSRRSLMRTANSRANPSKVRPKNSWQS